MQPWDAKKDGLALCGLALAALAMQLLLYDRWIGLLDEGAILQIADQITKGSVLYRDATHLAWPGVFYLTAGLFEVFGTNILVTRWLMVVAFTLLVCLVYLLARGVASREIALLTALVAVSYRAWVFPHWLMISYSPLASLMTITATALLAQNVRAASPRLRLAAGFAIGLAITFKQDSGGLGFILLIMFLLLDTRARLRAQANAPGIVATLLPFAGGAVIVPTIMAIALFAQGAGYEMFHQTVWVPLAQGKLWATEIADQPNPYLSFPPMWPPFTRSETLRGDSFFNYLPSLLLDLYWTDIFGSDWFQKTALPDIFVRFVYALPYAAILGLGVRELWSTATNRGADVSITHRQTRLLLCLAIGVLLAFNRPRDWIHLLVLYPGTIILLAPIIDALAGNASPIRRFRVVGIAGLTVLAGVAGSFVIAVQARGLYDTPITSSRAGIYVMPDDAQMINAVVDRLEAPAGGPAKPLGAIPYYPMFNFLTARPLATRFITILPLEKFPDRDEQVLASFASIPGTELLYGFQHLTGMPRPQDYAPTLFEGLTARYSLGDVFDSGLKGMVFALLEPREPVAPDAGATLYRFAEHVSEARFETPMKETKDGRGGGENVRMIAPTVSLATWAFERPVISFPATPEPGASRLVYDIEAGKLDALDSLDALGDGAELRLRFGVAMNPDEWRHFLPTGLRFRVRVDDRVVFERFLDPRRTLDDRRWIYADLPLTEVRLDAATPIRISFEASTDNGYGTVPNLAGFASPELVAIPHP
jgi:hypothetical protein